MAQSLTNLQKAKIQAMLLDGIAKPEIAEAAGTNIETVKKFSTQTETRMLLALALMDKLTLQGAPRAVETLIKAVSKEIPDATSIKAAEKILTLTGFEKMAQDLEEKVSSAKAMIIKTRHQLHND